MSIVLISEHSNIEEWIKELENQNPNTKIEHYPDVSNFEEVTYAISWQHPEGVFKKFPNLKVVASMGAGVRHILKDDELPENIKVTRIVDSQLTKDMSVFVLTQALSYIRNLPIHFQNQQKKNWKIIPYKTPEETNVGIMGLGVLGKAVAQLLLNNNFKVYGWAKSKKEIEGVTTYDKNGLDEFLAQAEILVCLLPITDSTKGILNKNLFSKLPKNAYLVNVARGEHLVEEDLIEAIAKNKLSGASLDVFQEEPLPENHSFWKHKRITITPHVASRTNPKSAAKQLIENYKRMKNGEELENQVDTEKGY
ncbi:MAG: 2-hydroxyacid dehydrogenase [Bacteroidota bacterium]